MLDKLNGFKTKLFSVFSVLMFSTWHLPGGESKTTWELAFDPFTRYVGDFFYLIIIMLVTMLIWFRTESMGPPLIWVTISSSVLAATPITTGWGQILFVIIAAFSVAVAGLRAAVRRELV